MLYKCFNGGLAPLDDPPTRWTDDLQRKAKSRCIQAAQDRVLWRSMQETFLQQWTSMSWTSESTYVDQCSQENQFSEDDEVKDVGVLKARKRNNPAERYKEELRGNFEVPELDCDPDAVIENEDLPPCTTCKYAKSKTCGSTKPGLSCRKPPKVNVEIPSVSSLTQSVGYNCRYCCCAIGELFKELYSSIQGDANSKTCDVLAEMSDVLLAIATDCVLFIRRIGCNAACKILTISHDCSAKVKNKINFKLLDKIKTKLEKVESKAKVTKRPKPKCCCSMP